VKEFTPELARRYSLNYEPGVIVLQVKEGGPADDAGIQPGDLIKEINRKPVRDLKSYENLMATQKKGAPLLLRIKRGDSNLFVSIRIAE
jgi:serine protease Do